jgi:hypothetical protein
MCAANCFGKWKGLILLKLKGSFVQKRAIINNCPLTELNGNSCKLEALDQFYYLQEEGLDQKVPEPLGIQGPLFPTVLGL